MIERTALKAEIELALTDLHLDHLFVIYPDALHTFAPGGAGGSVPPLRDLTVAGALRIG